MKDLFKKTLKFSVLFLFIAVTGCEKDIYEDAVQNTSKAKMRYVTIDDVPFLIHTIQDYNPHYTYLSNPNASISARDAADLNLDLNHIIEYLASNGFKSYSIPIKNEFASDKEDYYFENLHILQINGDFKAFIAKYNQTDDSKKFETPTFTGKIQIMDIDETPIDSVAFLNGQKMETPAPPSDPEEGEEPGGGGGSSTPPVTHGWVWNFFNWLFGGETDWNGIKDVPTSGGGSDDDSGDSAGSDGVWVIIGAGSTEVGQSPTPPTGGTTGGGTIVIVPNQPVWSEFAANAHMRANLICQRLGIEDAATIGWLRNLANVQASSEIYTYLYENNLTTNFYQANAFANYLLPIMMQNPYMKFDISASSKSPANIDLRQVTDNGDPNDPQRELKKKFRCVYDKLLQSPTFKKLFIDLFQDNTRPNVRFKILDLPGTADGGTVGYTVPLDNTGFNTEIQIDTQLLESGNVMAIVKTIMHECIHAYLDVKLADPSIGIPIPELSNLDVAECINTYYNSFNDQQAQHNFMFNYLTNTMNTILSELKDILLTPQQISNANSLTLHIIQNTMPSTVLDTPWNWNDYFKNLALDGLQNCSSFGSSIATYSSGTYSNVVDQHRLSEFIQYKNVAHSNLPPPNCN